MKRPTLFIVVTMLISALSIFGMNPIISHASGNTCVYVFGTIEGKTVTTPAILVPVPENSVAIDPVRVHVDSTNHEILGYSLTLPGIDFETEPKSIYTPGIKAEIPSYSITLNDLNIQNKTCVSFGVTTPAVPIHIPQSSLEAPGSVVNVPAVYLNILGEKRIVDGKVISIDGKTIVIPGVNAVIPSQTVETPDQSVSVDIFGSLKQAHYMTPQ